MIAGEGRAGDCRAPASEVWYFAALFSWFRKAPGGCSAARCARGEHG